MHQWFVNNHWLGEVHETQKRFINGVVYFTTFTLLEYKCSNSQAQCTFLKGRFSIYKATLICRTYKGFLIYGTLHYESFHNPIKVEKYLLFIPSERSSFKQYTRRNCNCYRKWCESPIMFEYIYLEYNFWI